MSNTDNNFSNASVGYYDTMRTTYRIGTDIPQANIFVSYAPNQPALGTVFGIHGYGGTPRQSLMQTTRDVALDNKFNFVAVESYDMSLTSHLRGPNDDTNATLTSFCRDIHVGISMALRDPKLAHGHKIAWGHCMGCRALVNNYAAYPRRRQTFDEYVFCAPYFMPSYELLHCKVRAYRTDPTGRLYNRLLKTIFTESHQTGGREYIFRRRLFSLAVEDMLGAIPREFISDDGHTDIEQYVDYLFRDTGLQLHASLDNKCCTMVIADQDDVVNFDHAIQFYNRVPIPTKSIVRLANENHTMNVNRTKYQAAADMILSRAKNILNNKMQLSHQMMFNKTL